jgi:hypothetical protein
MVNIRERYLYCDKAKGASINIDANSPLSSVQRIHASRRNNLDRGRFLYVLRNIQCIQGISFQDAHIGYVVASAELPTYQ